MNFPGSFKHSSKFFLLFALGFPLSVLAAASLDFAVGDVQAVSSVGVARPLAKGGRINAGDTVRVGDGRAQLRFDDGALVSLQPNTDFRIDEFQFSGQQDGRERGFFSLLKGGLRTLTGLVGKVNKGNYKVTTSVATIGIRGTEYTLSYLDSESIAIATAEGAIEVCNGGGCAVLVSGDSAVVEGAKTAPKRVDFRPQLRPAQPGEQLLPQFSTSEFRNQNGSVLLNGNQLTSGSGYSIAVAYPYTGTPNSSFFWGGQNGAATFGSNSQLLSANTSSTYTGSVLTESGSADGVIGWGRWAAATNSAGVTVNDLHYVVGRQMPVSQLAALNGITATYQLIGFTVPTGTLGYATGSPSGTLTASFGAATMSVSMALQVPYFNSMTTQTYAVNVSTGTVPLNTTFNWISPPANGGGGFFSGTGASHAGASYSFSAGGYTNVSGTVAFKR